MPNEYTLLFNNPVPPSEIETILQIIFFLKNNEEVVSKQALEKILLGNSPDGAMQRVDFHLKTLTGFKLIDLEGNDIITKIKEPEDYRETILNAFDKEVLADEKQDPLVSEYYSLLLYMKSKKLEKTTRTAVVRTWLATHEGDTNQEETKLNTIKIAFFDRWLYYTGLGYLEGNQLIPCSNKRIERSLKNIFGKKKSMDGDAFIKKCGELMLEQDGGKVFRKVNKEWNEDLKELTLGFSMALLTLHRQKKIKLICTADNPGWRLTEVNKDKSIQSDRINKVELLNA